MLNLYALIMFNYNRLSIGVINNISFDIHSSQCLRNTCDIKNVRFDNISNYFD